MVRKLLVVDILRSWLVSGCWRPTVRGAAVGRSPEGEGHEGWQADRLSLTGAGVGGRFTGGGIMWSDVAMVRSVGA